MRDLVGCPVDVEGDGCVRLDEEQVPDRLDGVDVLVKLFAVGVVGVLLGRRVVLLRLLLDGLASAR